MTKLTCPAGKLREGDYIPGLDNGYVIDVDLKNIAPYRDSRFYISRGDGLVSITFNTAEGDEGELIVPRIMPVTVETDDLDDRDEYSCDEDGRADL